MKFAELAVGTDFVFVAGAFKGMVFQKTGQGAAKQVGVSTMPVGADDEVVELLPETVSTTSRLTPAEKIPYVGMPATMVMYTDRHGATVTRIAKNFIEVRREQAFRVDNNGMSESQSYRFAEDPQGEVERAYRRADGAYHGKGFTVALGVRRSYHDYSF